MNQDQTTFSNVGEYLDLDHSLSIEVLGLMLFNVESKTTSEVDVAHYAIHEFGLGVSGR